MAVRLLQAYAGHPAGAVVAFAADVEQILVAEARADFRVEDGWSNNIYPGSEGLQIEGGIADAPADGKTYVRKGGAWEEATATGAAVDGIEDVPGLPTVLAGKADADAVSALAATVAGKADADELDEKADVTYVDELIGTTVQPAPSDGKFYAMQDGLWVEVPEGSAGAVAWSDIPNKPAVVAAGDTPEEALGALGVTATGQSLLTAGSTSAARIALQAADDTAVVKLAGAQTIGGQKIFSVAPTLPASDPASDDAAARKAYVDAVALGDTISPFTAEVYSPTRADTTKRILVDSATDRRLGIDTDANRGWLVGRDSLFVHNAGGGILHITGLWSTGITFEGVPGNIPHVELEQGCWALLSRVGGANNWAVSRSYPMASWLDPADPPTVADLRALRDALVRSGEMHPRLGPSVWQRLPGDTGSFATGQHYNSGGTVSGPGAVAVAGYPQPYRVQSAGSTIHRREGQIGTAINWSTYAARYRVAWIFDPAGSPNARAFVNIGASGREVTITAGTPAFSGSQTGTPDAADLAYTAIGGGLFELSFTLNAATTAGQLTWGFGPYSATAGQYVDLYRVDVRPILA
jgi:hypothetical protein